MLGTAVACTPADRDPVAETGPETSGGQATTGDGTDGEVGSSTTASGSEGTPTTGMDPDETGPGGGGTGDVRLDVAGATDGGNGEGGSSGDCTCAPKLDLIYVLTESKELWTFDPRTDAFAPVGPVPCESQIGFSATTFSMGLGRDGRAWIQYGGGDLYTVDVSDPATCVDPGYMPGQHGITTFGMGFVSNGPTDPCDQLYGHSSGLGSSGMLATLDTDTLQFSTIKSTGESLVELSGTGDGRLFAFADQSLAGSKIPLLLELDRQTGDELERVELPDVPSTPMFAFAFWGGDFYFFTGDSTGSAVSKMDWDESDGPGRQVTTVVPNAPITIVGAGTSTCVPFDPVG